MDEWYTHNHVISLCLFLIAYMQVCLPVSVSRHKHVGREKMIATGGCAWKRTKKVGPSFSNTNINQEEFFEIVK